MALLQPIDHVDLGMVNVLLDSSSSRIRGLSGCSLLALSADARHLVVGRDGKLLLLPQLDAACAPRLIQPVSASHLTVGDDRACCACWLHRESAYTSTSASSYAPSNCPAPAHAASASTSSPAPPPSPPGSPHNQTSTRALQCTLLVGYSSGSLAAFTSDGDLLWSTQVHNAPLLRLHASSASSPLVCLFEGGVIACARSLQSLLLHPTAPTKTPGPTLWLYNLAGESQRSAHEVVCCGALPTLPLDLGTQTTAVIGHYKQTANHSKQTTSHSKQTASRSQRTAHHPRQTTNHQKPTANHSKETIDHSKQSTAPSNPKLVLVTAIASELQLHLLQPPPPPASERLADLFAARDGKRLLARGLGVLTSAILGPDANAPEAGAAAAARETETTNEVGEEPELAGLGAPPSTSAALLGLGAPPSASAQVPASAPPRPPPPPSLAQAARSMSMASSFAAFRPVVSREGSTSCVRTLTDAPRGFTHLALEPRRRRWLAATDTLGRVLLLEPKSLVCARLFKGYRDAQCGWTEASHGTCDGASDRHEGFTDGGASVPLLVIYAPRRGLLEIWRAPHGGRIFASNVGPDCVLLCSGSERQCGQRCFLVQQRTGIIFAVKRAPPGGVGSTSATGGGREVAGECSGVAPGRNCADLAASALCSPPQSPNGSDVFFDAATNHESDLAGDGDDEMLTPSRYYPGLCLQSSTSSSPVPPAAPTVCTPAARGCIDTSMGID